MADAFKGKIFKAAVFSLILAAILIWIAVFEIEAGGGFLRLYFFDVGQGDAEFIEAPGGNQVLIDGGPDNSILAELGRAMPFWDHSIDLLILTHPNADHLDGLVEVLKRYKIGKVLETDVNYSIPEYEEWHRLLKEKNIEIIIAKKGQKIRLSNSVYLEILGPSRDFVGKSIKNINDAMIVAKLYYASTTALFTGDAGKSLEDQLLAEGADLRSDILKVGHHGSKTSSSEEFLKAVSPRIAVISVGAKNRYGHPTQEVLDRLTSFGVKIFRTDRDGDVNLISDGTQFKVAK